MDAVRRCEPAGGGPGPDAQGCDVQAALLGRIPLPPPPSRPLVLAGAGGPGAGGAADRGVAAGVEGVAGEVVGADVVPDVLIGPARERGHLGDAAVRLVAGDHRGVAAGRGLTAAQPGDPGVVAGQGAGQRPRLAHVAAEVAQLRREVEEVGAVLSGHRSDLAGLGCQDVEPDPEAPPHLVDEVVGLLGQAAGVEGDDLDLRAQPAGHVDEDDGPRLQAGDDRAPAGSARRSRRGWPRGRRPRGRGRPPRARRRGGRWRRSWPAGRAAAVDGGRRAAGRRGRPGHFGFISGWAGRGPAMGSRQRSGCGRRARRVARGCAWVASTVCGLGSSGRPRRAATYRRRRRGGRSPSHPTGRRRRAWRDRSAWAGSIPASC